MKLAKMQKSYNKQLQINNNNNLNNNLNNYNRS
jgi:hypothetical protein